MKIRFVLIFVLLACFFILLPLPLKARLIINEICWMGAGISHNDEWLELYNDGESPLSLDGWRLFAEDGSPDIKLKGLIAAKGYFLLERTDDGTAPNVPADLIFKGGLGNKGEYLKLADEKGVIVDQANFSSGWPFGDNQTKQTMEKGLLGWQTSEKTGGTPKEKNSSGALPQPQKNEWSNKESLNLQQNNKSFPQEETADSFNNSGVKPKKEAAPPLQAAISQSAAGSPKPLIVSLIAAIIALVSVITTLLFKLRSMV